MEPQDVAVPGRRFPPHVSRRAALISTAVAVGVVVSIVAAVLLVNRPGPAPVAAAPTPPRPRPRRRRRRRRRPRRPARRRAPPSPAPVGPDPVLGSDGRLTVLLLGSDDRASHSGNRTDVIMVVSLDPTTGAVAAASIPRDTAELPDVVEGDLSGQDQRPVPVADRPDRSAEGRRRDEADHRRRDRRRDRLVRRQSGSRASASSSTPSAASTSSSPGRSAIRTTG